MKEKIKEGGFSEVYSLDGTRALIVSKEGSEQIFDTQLRLIQEVNKQDPGIFPPILQTSTHEGRSAYITNLYDGDFSDLSKKEDLEIKVDGLLQATRKLSRLHDLGYVHGDFKPANILYHEESEHEIDVVLTDPSEHPKEEFLNSVVSVVDLPFTFDYAAPEVRAGGKTTTSSNIYSLARIVWEVLAGRKLEPYQPALSNIVKKGPNVLNKKYEYLDSLIKKAVTKEAGSRPSLKVLMREINSINLNYQRERESKEKRSRFQSGIWADKGEETIKKLKQDYDDKISFVKFINYMLVPCLGGATYMGVRMLTGGSDFWGGVPDNQLLTTIEGVDSISSILTVFAAVFGLSNLMYWAEAKEAKKDLDVAVNKVVSSGLK